MVGVPGRSKGCKTCRRRKKGCDLKRPECGQCIDRGLVCGGYDRDRVFVVQNIKFGPSAGEDNAEAIERKSRDKKRTQQLDFLIPGYPCLENEGFQIGRRSQSPASSGDAEVVLPPSLARTAYTQKNMGLYLDMYLPSEEPSKGKVLGLGWPIFLNDLYLQDEALRIALMAVTSAAAGQAHGDKALMERGKRLYGWSLCELTKALANERRAKSHALLAVPRVMGLFEILFGADLDLKIQAESWHSHAAGDLALMKAQGPEAFKYGIAHSLFAEGRMNPIISYLGLRKAIILNSPEWKTIPWEEIAKTPKDALLDILAAIPELLEEFDKIIKSSYEESSPRIHDLLDRCRRLEEELDGRYAHNLDNITEPKTEVPEHMNFPDLANAHLSVLSWTAYVLLYQVMNNLSPLVMLPTSLQFPPRQPFRRTGRFWARRITRAAAYFFRPSSGIWGAVMISFPTGNALLCLRLNTVEEDNAYNSLVFQSWANPKLPTNIKSFLLSMRKAMDERRGSKWAKRVN